jgi:hypothetical protein
VALKSLESETYVCVFGSQPMLEMSFCHGCAWVMNWSGVYKDKILHSGFVWSTQFFHGHSGQWLSWKHSVEYLWHIGERASCRN